MGALVVVKTAHIIAHPIFRYKQKNKKKQKKMGMALPPRPEYGIAAKPTTLKLHYLRQHGKVNTKRQPVGLEGSRVTSPP